MQHFTAMKQATLTRSMILSATALLAMAGTGMAQERDNRKANSMSVRPIDDSDIMMKKTLWRRIDLKETQNTSMFSKNNEITKYLMDAVKAGLLDAYVANDSTNRKIDPAKFHELLLVPNQDGGLSKEEIDAGFGKTDAAGGKDDGWGNAKKQDDPKAAKKPADDGWGTPAPKKAAAQPADDGWGTPAKKVATTKKGKKGAKTTQPVALAKKDTVAAPVSSTATSFSGDERFAKEFSILEVKEDWIFDKKRSRLYYDIQTVTMLLPADKNSAGFEVPIASFKYKDLDKLFRSDPKKFIWYNPQNQAQHKNLADAFDLRLFYGRITKVANPEDKELVGLYGSEKEGLLKSYQTEYELMELEHGLWEY